MSRAASPLEAVMRGLVAGVIGTGVMTAAQELSARLAPSQNGGAQDGDGDPWQRASAPAKVARRISQGVLRRDVSPERIPLLTHAMHWGYGIGWGGLYGVVQGTFHGPPLRTGPLFGAGVWVMSYVQLVPMGLYEPPWKYPPKELAMDFGYHAAYGLGIGSGHRLLERW